VITEVPHSRLDASEWHPTAANGFCLTSCLRVWPMPARRNDRSTAERYRRRLRLAVEQVADEPVQDALKRVLLVSGLWIKAAEIDRDETAQQMLKLIDRGLGRSHRDKLFS
jgi:hypothetical protein